MPRGVALGIVTAIAVFWGAVGVAVVWFVGREEQGTSGEKSLASFEPTRLEKMPFSEWDSDPELLFVFSGQQRGRLKPCGCSPAFQKGGLARRAGFIRYVREQKAWPCVLLDLGGLLDDPEETYGLAQYVPGPEHRLAKLEVTLQSLRHMGYDAIGVGPEDTMLENATLTYVSALMDMQPLAATNCNLSVPEDLQTVIRPYVLLERAGFKIGVVGLVGEKASRKIRDSITPLVWVPPEDAVAAVMPRLAECDVKVALFYADENEARQLAKAYPDFDVIIHASEYDEPTGREVWEGKTLLVTVGKKGKYAGAIGYWPNRAEKRFAFELVALDDRFEDDPEVKEYTRGLYLDKLKALRIVELIVKKPLPDGETIAGVEACRSCHPRVVAKWEASRHAVALETLKRTGDHVDPECLSCHTTFFGYQGGYDGTPATAHLGGNQCENCHGPAGRHVRDPENPLFRSQLHRESVSAEAQLCRRCHDAENDPHFVFGKRWPEVVHTQEARADALEYRRQRTKGSGTSE